MSHLLQLQFYDDAETTTVASNRDYRQRKFMGRTLTMGQHSQKAVVIDCQLITEFVSGVHRSEAEIPVSLFNNQ